MPANHSTGRSAVTAEPVVKEHVIPTEMPFPGAVDHDGRVTFTLYAPGKETVHIIGDFNSWDLQANPLRQVDKGLWSTEVELIGGTYAYQFVIDGESVVCDPYARQVEYAPENRPPRGLVRVSEEPYLWRHELWNRPQFAGLMIYELHIADFTPERSFRGAAKRLDYLRDLGVTAIELMPVFEVESDVGWGYAPTYLFAPNRDYGTANELRLLIDEAHARGIAVILDIVLSHTGHEHPFNRMYHYDKSPWYGQGAAGPNEFGLPTLQYAKDATQAFARDVVQYWVRDFHVDGFRFDYLKMVGSKEDKGAPVLAKAAREARADIFLIGEEIPENPQEIGYSGFDAGWHARFSYAMKAILTQGEHNGFKYDQFDRAVQTLLAETHGYTKPSMMINYLESHDEERTMLALRQAGQDDDTAKRKAALGATVLLTAAGEPMIYHGQEWGESTARNMDHNFIGWQTLQTDGGKGLVEHFRRILHLRAEHNGLTTDNINIDRVYPDQKCLVYRRWNNMGDEIVIAVNFSPQTQKINVPFPGKKTWREIFSNQTKEIDAGADFELERWSALVFVVG